MNNYYLEIATSSQEQMLDITLDLTKVLKRLKWHSGAMFLFIRHTTCALTINERADPAVQADLQRFFCEIAPRHHNWQHLEGNSDAHIRSSLMGVSLWLPVVDNELALGVWQGVFLYEGDGPRKRIILVQFFANA